MLTLDTRSALRAAILNPSLDHALRAVLRLRFEQTGGTGAAFHVAHADDDHAVAEAAVGWPLLLDDTPCWEWAERHPGWIEVVFVLSDDGPAQVLLIPTDSPLADHLADV